MISKDEWLAWRKSEVTLRLLELMDIGKEAAVEELIDNRGGVGDYMRGAIQTFDEISHHIRTGDQMYEEKKV